MLIEIPIDDLLREAYRFWINFPEVRFDGWYLQRRATKRHGFKTVTAWERLGHNRRASDGIQYVPKPEIPAAIMAQALKMAADKLQVIA